ncbi:hypothetical protein SARC_14977, partial [Sphaeroforma arctica JP610]
TLAWRGRYKRHEVELTIASTATAHAKKPKITPAATDGNESSFNPTSTDLINATANAQEKHVVRTTAAHELCEDDHDAFEVNPP